MCLSLPEVYNMGHMGVVFVKLAAPANLLWKANPENWDIYIFLYIFRKIRPKPQLF